MVRRKGYDILKRALDIFFSLCLISFLLLPLAIIWLAVKLDSRGKGIFKQTRIGKNGIPFVCYKFRTMYDNSPHDRPTRSFDESDRYITCVGRFLRKTSLDELPQLFNVLKGDMSIVGPRPLIPEEQEMHLKRDADGIYGLRPGITGLSQVRGRDMLCDEEKLRYDKEYLDSCSLLEDMKILFLTLTKVLRCEGVKEKLRTKRAK